MYGGWYVVITRDERTSVVLYGPCASRDKLPVIDERDIKSKLIASDLAYEPRHGEAFDVAFLLFPRLFVGILNKSAWITITKEEWKPT